MAKQDYIPQRDADLDKYEENFVNKLLIHAAALGIDQNLLNELQEGINAHRASFSKMLSKRAEAKSATEENYTNKQRALNNMRRGAKIIKSLTNYSNAIGDDLGIIGAEMPPKDLTEIKPGMSAKSSGQIVKLKFTKEDSDGIRIYSRKGPETGFTVLAFATHSPYVDNRPKENPNLPENREYYAVYVIDMNEIGIASDKISATIP